MLVAPPGTGKTTAVPPALLGEDWLGDQRIIMLEPRRLAASASARRIAAVSGEKVGRTFGYSIRGESRTSRDTRVEVVTEGLFLRRIQNDPELSGIGAVVLDEFHERSVDADLALALVNDVRRSLRPDLRIMVMSATMDPDPVADMIGASVVTVAAPMHPIETRYRPGSVQVPIEERTADVVIEAIANDPGDVLVFLPGRGEIGRTHRLLDERLDGRPSRRRRSDDSGNPDNGTIEVVELHGSLSPAQQQQALDPDPDGRRRVILATSIAETSITVPGVRVVIDAGRRRTTRLDPNSGVPSLVTVPVSLAGADQRRGRAGRIAPGVSYRLWSREDERHRPAADTPGILVDDLAPLLLQLRAWGIDDAAELEWLDSPPAEALDRAAALLTVLAAVDSDGRLTPLGRDFVRFGFHPRLAAMAVTGVGLGQPDLAARICVVVETSRSGSVDVMDHVDASRGGPGGRAHVIGSDAALERSLRQWRDAIESYRGDRTQVDEGRAASRSGGSVAADGATGIRTGAALTSERILLAGYPDRVARRRESLRTTGGRSARVVFQMRVGGEFTVPPDHPFESVDWLVAADLDQASGRLHLGLAIGAETVMDVLAANIEERDVVEWNDRDATIEAKHVRSLGAITLSERTIRRPSSADVSAAVAEAFSRRGPMLFGRLSESDEFRARVELAHAHHPDDGWPDLSDSSLAENLLDWISPAMVEVTSAADMNRVDVTSLLRSRMQWDQLRRLDELAPMTWTLASGRNVRLHYERTDDDVVTVVARVRIGDVLGTDVHPMVLSGRVPVVVELLSPAGRPVQRTTDLPGFWRGTYRDVRADLRGRYPKHPWPVEPWNEPPRMPRPKRPGR